MSWITAPFAWLLKALYELTGSYGWAVILFGVVVNLILLPFMAKSKKSMMRTSRLQPRIAELQRRHEGNQQKLNEEMAKLYREEKINPMSGCLWSLIPFPILIALYSVIRQPLTKMMSLSAEAVTQLTDWVTTNAGYVAQTKSAYQEIQIADLIHQNWDAVTGALGDFSGKLLDIDYSFIGLNMGQQPSFKIWTFDWSNKAVWLPALGLFLIPIVSAVLSWLSMKISTAMTPQPVANQQQAATTNKTMMIMMPLVSLWICYTMPAALGIYWIVNSILGILRDVSLTKVFNKQLDKLDAERIAREKERDAELERKRLETERLKAAGETVVNPNTSKKKIQASQKQKDDERKAAAMREERAARRERLGVEQAAQSAQERIVAEPLRAIGQVEFVIEIGGIGSLIVLEDGLGLVERLDPAGFGRGAGFVLLPERPDACCGFCGQQGREPLHGRKFRRGLGGGVALRNGRDVAFVSLPEVVDQAHRKDPRQVEFRFFVRKDEGQQGQPPRVFGGAFVPSGRGAGRAQDVFQPFGFAHELQVSFQFFHLRDSVSGP